MITQNTYPDFFEEKKDEEKINITQKTKEPNFIEDLIKFDSVKNTNIENQDKRSLYSVICSVFLGLALIASGWAIINLNLWFIPLFIILFVLFVISNLISFLFKNSRNQIWYHLLGIGIPYFILMIATGTILTGTAWIAGILILFLIFISFLELENALNLNRIFRFKAVTYQSKKLLILSAIVLTTMGSFMSIYSQGGAKYIENTIGKNEIYKALFDPSIRTALFGRAIINERILKSIDGSATTTGNPLTLQDFLMLKIENSSITKNLYYENFADFSYCKASPIQADEECKTKLTDYAKLTLATTALNEYGIDINKGEIKLSSPMTKDNIKYVIKKSYSHNIEEFIGAKNSATNPLKIYSILGKNEGIALFISMFLFIGLLLTYLFYNILITIFSNIIFNILKKKGFVKLISTQAQVEYLEI